MNAVIYARYSSHAQRDESIEGQLRECYDYASKNNYTVIHEYIDRALSGKTDNRPSFQKLIKDSEKKKFEAVIMYTLDRFARNRYDSAIYKAKLKKNGVKVLYAKQPLPDTPEGIILEAMLEGYAEYYSENLSRNVKRGLKENALQGKVAGGTLPLGYIKSEDNHFNIDPDTAPVVRFIFEQFASGVTVKEICKELNRRGCVTAFGNPFTYHSFNRILHNKKYIGIYTIGETECEGVIPPIVSKDLFERAQLRFRTNVKGGHGKANEEYLLSGKAFCGLCNSPLYGESGTSKNGKLYHYYKCMKRKQKTNCVKKPERKQWLEDTVIQALAENVLTDENIDKIAQRTAEFIEKETSDNSKLIFLQNQLKIVDKKIDNIHMGIENGLFDKTTKPRLDELNAQQEKLEGLIENEKCKLPVLTKSDILLWLNRFKTGDADNVQYRKTLIDTLLQSVYVYDDGDDEVKLTLNFNTFENNHINIKCSNGFTCSELKEIYPNTIGGNVIISLSVVYKRANRVGWDLNK